MLKYEIQKIGGTDLKVSDGKISFTGDENILARANICLSTAERVLIELIEFKAFVAEVDPDAFVTFVSASMINGEGFDPLVSKISLPSLGEGKEEEVEKDGK